MNARTPAISVLMSVRNGLPYLRQTVESVITQTSTDWEFIIVDNASSDGSSEFVAQIAAQEPRIRLFRNPVDLGHSGGLNRGMAECRGRWIARIDADDVALPQRFERQMQFLAENPDVRVTSCLASYINASGKVVGKTFHDLTTREAFQQYLREELAIGILHPGAVIDRELLLAVGGYREQFKQANDIDLWGRLVDAGALLLVQPEILMKYRVHGGSLTAKSFRDARLKYQWARDCMRARRRGLPEPTLRDYVADRESAPWWIRWNRLRKTLARQFYRQAALDHISERSMKAAVEFAVATVCQPSYTLQRIKGQVSK